MVEVRTGLRQSDALSPILFNLIIEKVIREKEIGRDEGIIMDRTCFSVLTYVANIVLLGEEEQQVVDLYGRLIESAKKVGQHFNIEKTQYMNVSREQSNAPVTDTIIVGQYKFKKVKQFKYLSTIVTQKNECQVEI